MIDVVSTELATPLRLPTLGSHDQMLDSNRRIFLHLFATVKSVREKTKADPILFTMREAIEGLLGDHGQQPIVLLTGKDDRKRLDIREVSDHADAIVFLFSYSDIKLSDPTLQDRTSGDISRVPKQQGKAWAYSAHLALGYERLSNGCYPALLEKVPHVSRSAIQTLVNRNFIKNPYVLDDGEECGPRLSMDGEPSDELAEALAKGRLSAVDLIHSEDDPNGGTDESGMIEVRQTVRYKFPRLGKTRQSVARRDPLAAIRSLWGKAKAEDYQNLRVLLNQQGDPTVPQHIDIPTDAEEFNKGAFIRRTSKTFSSTFDNAHRSINPVVERHMLSRLREKYA